MRRLPLILALFSSFTSVATANVDATSTKASFEVAKSCFLDCTVVNNSGQRRGKSPPETFASLLKDASWSKVFVSLVKALPPAFSGFALIAPDEEIRILKMEGALEARVKQNGRVFYIYEKAGLPSGSSESPRRPVGNLSVIVDLDHKEMAGFWNGTANFSQYQFVGSNELLGILIAYNVANEAEKEKAYLVSMNNRPDAIVLPLPDQRKAYTWARLDYLESKLFGAGIFGARSPLDAGDELRSNGQKSSDVKTASSATLAPSGNWYAMDDLEHRCATGPDHNPGDTIQNAQAAHQRYTTNDTTDPVSGQIMETTIEFPDVGGQITFYRGAERCQAAFDRVIGSQKNDVDKYR